MIKVSGIYHVIDSWELSEHERFMIVLDGKVILSRAFDNIGNLEILHRIGNGNPD